MVVLRGEGDGHEFEVVHEAVVVAVKVRPHFCHVRLCHFQVGGELLLRYQSRLGSVHEEKGLLLVFEVGAVHLRGEIEQRQALQGVVLDPLVDLLHRDYLGVLLGFLDELVD